MAQRVQITLEDDIDKTPADETVRFGLDGAAYEIDLSSNNARQLRDSLETWIVYARKSSATRGPRRAGPAAHTDREQLNKMREWGRTNGFKVSDRGRVPNDLQEAFQRAQAHPVRTEG